jgi:hypothetical protein
MILCEKDDEDKGSSHQSEANSPASNTSMTNMDYDNCHREKKIESSAEALWVCHRPFIFPSSINFILNTAWATRRIKL